MLAANREVKRALSVLYVSIDTSSSGRAVMNFSIASFFFFFPIVCNRKSSCSPHSHASILNYRK